MFPSAIFRRAAGVIAAGPAGIIAAGLALASAQPAAI